MDAVYNASTWLLAVKPSMIVAQILKELSQYIWALQKKVLR